jgi:predicted CopG family antitoxin
MSTFTGQDLEVFLDRNQELIQRCERLYRKLLDIRKEKDSLADRLGEIEEEKRRLEEELASLQQMTDSELYQGGRTLAQIRDYIADLLVQTRDELSEYE